MNKLREISLWTGPLVTASMLHLSHRGSHLLGVCALSDCCTWSFSSGVTELLVIKCTDCLVTGMSLLLSTLSKYDWASFFLMGMVRMDLPHGVVRI